ncbi:hypothetical protein HanPSC8_Chr16g0694621 [Helianthus annuus]|nr:hypothetical protein HanPSC8_Chr16g0694621 [Helianthus annuus]
MNRLHTLMTMIIKCPLGIQFLLTNFTKVLTLMVLDRKVTQLHRMLVAHVRSCLRCEQSILQGYTKFITSLANE